VLAEQASPHARLRIVRGADVLLQYSSPVDNKKRPLGAAEGPYLLGAYECYFFTGAAGAAGAAAVGVAVDVTADFVAGAGVCC
jgi:hypothetical protein